MKEGIYIDVVSKTIIAQLSESMAQFVGNSVSQEIKKVLLTGLPGVIGDEIGPVVSNARKSVQKATEKSGKRVLDQLEEIQNHILLDSDKTDNALNNFEAFVKTELIQVQNTLVERLGGKKYNLHDKIINSIQKLVQDRFETKIDAGKLKIQSKKVIDVLDARIRDLENGKAEVFFALNESITSAENLQVISEKEIGELNAKIDGFQNEKDDQELHITRYLTRINMLTNQVADLNNKLKESELIVENAAKEKAAMEMKLTVIQDLWEKQRILQKTF